MPKAIGRSWKPLRPHPRTATTLSSVMLALWLASPSSGQADMYRPQPRAGGIDSRPVITSLTLQGSNATLRFHGLQAPYQVQGTTRLEAPSAWTTVSAAALKWPDYSGSATVSNIPQPAGFFRLQMSGHDFVGVNGCYACHDEKIYDWQFTGHARAMDSLTGSSGSLYPSNAQDCVVCHSVGYNQGGFVSLTDTPQLAGVGCEACHGAAGAHVFISGRRYHPVSTIAAEVCGGCHTTPFYPTYDEWTNSAHATVTPDVAYGASGITNTGTTGWGRQMSCGPCHSGATRLAMLANLEAQTAGYTNALALPTPNDGATYGVTCAVCHDSHSTNGGPSQLRNPLFSTEFYTFFTGSDTRTNISTDVFGAQTTNVYYMNTVFATQHVATVQICGQCHNSRGAVWTGTSRPPHHSPQYNLLVGTVQPGYLNGTENYIGPHGLNPKGCTACHMAPTRVAHPTAANPNYTGHEYRVTLNGCAALECHDSTNVAGALMTAVQLDIASRTKGVVDLLNAWATNKAPTITNAFIPYGQYAWEFTSAGQLSNPTNNPAIVGPSSALQARIPELIKKARFNLYLVEHDASQGVHNIDYSRFLLRDARTNVLKASQ